MSEKKGEKEVEAISEKKGEKKVDIFTIELIPPLLLVAAYLYFLNFLSKGLEFELTQSNDDPFKKCWWTGPLCFTAIYLLAVTFGPKWMENRSEFKITHYVFVYNLYQCVLNIWTVYEMISEVATNSHFKGNPWGNAAQPMPGGFRIAFLVWIHYNNKYIELLDSLFMILRKKKEQLSFLHCYHHVLLIWAWFYVCKREAGGDCYFGACVNSFIHVIMYGYYTLALLNIPCPWKKWITNCQMAQFCLVLSHSCFVVYKGHMPIDLPLAQAFVMINMLVLFSQFYKKSYGPKDGKGAKKIQ